MSSDDRRRQLLGIGLRMLVEKPIQQLSLDAVAAEAGISRGLLFHYFPNKTAYHDAVVAAAMRRVRRNTSPDEGVTGMAAVEQYLERFLAQVERRREFYVALVFGNGNIALGGEGVETQRMQTSRRIAALLERPDAVAVIHAWTAYVEDRALQWSAPSHPETGSAREPAVLADEVRHCSRALEALLELG